MTPQRLVLISRATYSHVLDTHCHIHLFWRPIALLDVFERLFPSTLNNAYPGHKLALWIFAFVVLARSLQSVMIIFNGYATVTRADGIPLDDYSPPAAQTIVALYALYALSRLIISFLCLI